MLLETLQIILITFIYFYYKYRSKVILLFYKKLKRDNKKSNL